LEQSLRKSVLWSNGGALPVKSIPPSHVKVSTKAPTGIAGFDEHGWWKVRMKSLRVELVAKQVEKASLARTKVSREGELSRGRTRMQELRGADAAIPGRK
jgi:hypothetical protein